MEDNHEILRLKNNLDVYKTINRDLTNKVQELKLYLNQQIQILEVTKKELMEERVNSAKYKHFIKTNITMCSQFYNNVINNLNECVVTTDLDISIPDPFDPDKHLDNEEMDQARPSIRVNPRTSKLYEINRLYKNVTKNRNELLYTIDESQMSLSTISAEDVEPTEQINESDRQSLRISTPNTSKCPALQEFHNITLIPIQPMTSPKNQQDSTNQLCSSNSVDSRCNTNQDTPRKIQNRDTREPRSLSNSEDEPLQKKKSISVELLAVSLTEQQLQEYLDKYDNNYDYEDDNESLFSSTTTTASTAISEASAATSEANATTSKKRKSRVKVVPMKRKSRGRPKRKAALNISLAEKSCRTKLRRSN